MVELTHELYNCHGCRCSSRIHMRDMYALNVLERILRKHPSVMRGNVFNRVVPDPAHVCCLCNLTLPVETSRTLLAEVGLLRYMMHV